MVVRDKWRNLFIFSFLFFFFKTSQAAAGVEYIFEALLNGNNQAINNVSQVVGVMKSPAHAFYFDDQNGISDLGVFSGNNSEATSISDQGVVVGFSTYDNSGRVVGFKWDGSGSIQRLDQVLDNSHAYGINNLGVIVGDTPTPTSLKAILWDTQGNIVDVGPSGSFAYGINDLGQVVGQALDHAFIWDEVNGLVDLDPLPPGSSSNATAISNAGKVVGNWYLPSTNQIGVLWDEFGQKQIIGTIDNETRIILTDINDHDVAVGYSESRALVWDEINGLRDLNDLVDQNIGYFLASATSINNLGQIVGTAYLGGNNAFVAGYRLTKIMEEEPEPTIPEPATMLLFGTSLLGIFFRKKLS